MSRVCGNWIKAYMEYSAHSEAPDKFHFWTAISVLAGSLRRHVWIDCGYFQWVPNFYIIFVAPPGIVSKSTTAAIGMDLLREVEAVHFGPDAITWQALTQSLAASTERFDIPGGEEMSMSAITIVGSELGTLLNPHDREMIDAFVSLWDGKLGEWRKATKTCGSDVIRNPWLNLLGCTTPAWICGNFPDYMIGGGFTSRTVFVYAEHKRQLIAYPHRHMNKDHDLLKWKLIQDLKHISEALIGPYKLTDEAIEWGTEWYSDHYNNGSKHLRNETFGGYIARKQTHIHKLAIIMAAAERDELVITKEDLETSAAMITSLEEDMPKVFANIGRTDQSRQSQALISTIYSHGKITSEELYRHMHKTMNVKEFEMAVMGARKAGLIGAKEEGGKVWFFPTKKSPTYVEKKDE